MTTTSFFYVKVRHKGKTPEERFILFQEKRRCIFYLVCLKSFEWFLKKKNEFLMGNLLLNELFAAKYKNKE